MATDPLHRTVVLFGGVASDGNSLGDTWIWDGGTWTQRFPATSPPPRASARMAWAAADSRVLLCGGSQSTDTWLWDGTNWTRGVGNSACGTMSIGYAAGASQVVGYDVADGTWQWDGTEWRSAPDHTTSTRPQAYSPGLTWDTEDSVAFLFGGSTPNGDLDGTWWWDGGGWHQYAVQVHPPARTSRMLVHDTATRQSVLFGGNQGNAVLGDTWTWDGAAWRQDVSLPSPMARAGGALAVDPVSGAVMLFGGADDRGTWFNDTWLYRPAPSQRAAPSGTQAGTPPPPGAPGAGHGSSYQGGRLASGAVGSVPSASSTTTLPATVVSPVVSPGAPAGPGGVPSLSQVEVASSSDYSPAIFGALALAVGAGLIATFRRRKGG